MCVRYTRQSDLGSSSLLPTVNNFWVNSSCSSSSKSCSNSSRTQDDKIGQDQENNQSPKTHFWVSLLKLFQESLLSFLLSSPVLFPIFSDPSPWSPHPHLSKTLGPGMASDTCWASSCCSVMSASSSSTLSVSLRTRHTAKESGRHPPSKSPQAPSHHWLSHLTQMKVFHHMAHTGFYEALKRIEFFLPRMPWPAWRKQGGSLIIKNMMHVLSEKL